MPRKNTRPGSPNPVQFIGARIITDQLFRYNVKFLEYLPDLSPLEYVRLIVYYYIRVLYAAAPAPSGSSYGAAALMSLIDELTKTPIKTGENIINRLHIAGEIEIIDTPPMIMPKKIVLNLLFLDRIRRKLEVEFAENLSPRHMMLSIPVIIQKAIEKMDCQNIDILRRSLINATNKFNACDKNNIPFLISDIPEAALVEAVQASSADPSCEEAEPIFSTIERIAKTYAIEIDPIERRWIVYYRNALSVFAKDHYMDRQAFYAICAVCLHESLFAAGMDLITYEGKSLGASSLEKAEKLIPWPSVKYALAATYKKKDMLKDAYDRFLSLETDAVENRALNLKKFIPKIMQGRDDFENLLVRILDKQAISLNFKRIDDIKKAAKNERIALELKNPWLKKEDS